MSTTEFSSIRDLAHPRVNIQWHEAIAVVAETGDALVAQGHELLPDLRDFGLTADGAAAIRDDVAGTERAVRQLGCAMSLLFDVSDAPDPARQLAALAATAPEDERVDQFVSALRFYERPDRPEILKALGTRAALVRAELASENEFERLQERARETAAQPREAVEPTPESPNARARRRQWAAAAIAFIGLAAVAAAIAFVPTLRQAVASPLARYFAPAPIEPRPLPDPAATAGTPAATRGSRRDGAGVATPAPGAADIAGSDGPPSGASSDPDSPGMLFTVITEDPGRAVPGDEVTTLGTPVYSAATPGIVPPALLRQQLPSEPPPGVSPADVGVFDLLIDETGSVERVQLKSPANRFQERMLLAAAKAWKFRPAELEGRRVRYRMQVRITW